MIFVSEPILTSLGQGPIMGALIMGRNMDSEEIDRLSQTVGLPITVDRYYDPQIPNDFKIAKSSLTNNDPMFVQPLSQDYVAGYSLVNDVSSNPGLIIRIESPRDFYTQGLATTNFFIVLALSLCIVFGMAMMLLLEKGILNPIQRLTAAVKEMATTSGDSYPTITLEKNEIKLLSEAMKNSMSLRLAAIEELAGMVGHDLRNPLTGIAGAAYYVRKNYGSEMDAKGQAMLKVIEDDVNYSNKIVNDLLEYSRKIKLELRDITPKSLIADVLALSKIPENIKLADITENEPIMKADVDKLKRAFTNIINNAVDAMPNGGSLTIRSDKVGASVRFIFEDTGSGIPKDLVDKIGTPLFTTKAKGMGFGFSISKRLITAHDGTIAISSVVNKGTTITITLPIRPDNKETRSE